MKIAKKLLAVVMALAMIAAFAAVAFAAPSGSVVFTPGEYDTAKGRIKVAGNFVNAVGVKSGKIKFSFADGDVTKIVMLPGADADNTGKLGNSMNSEFNDKDLAVSEYGFYFKEDLYSSEVWAEKNDDLDAGVTINGENFNFATFTFTGKQGATITVTGNLVFADGKVDLNQTFTLGTAPVPACDHAGMVKHDAKAATCKEEGSLEYYTCPKCNKNFSDAAGTKELTGSTTIAKLTTHEYEYAVDKAACTVDKCVSIATCKVCGTKDTVTTNHKWDNGKVTKEATQTEEGTKLYTCTVCGFEKTEPIAKKGTQKIYDIEPNNNGVPYVCPCGNKECKCTNKDCKCDGKNPVSKCTDAKCPCNCKPAADKPTEKAAANNGNKTAPKTDGGKNTGDNSVLAIMAGVIALAGAAYVATKKRK